MPHFLTRVSRHVGYALAIAFAPCLLHAAPAAGTAINNTAMAAYPTPSGLSLPHSSNTVTAVIQPLAALQLTVNQRVTLAPGGAFTISHVLTNTGNMSTTYILGLSADGGTYSPTGLQIIEDLNGNGVADPGEPAIASGATITLAQNAAMRLLVTGAAPASAAFLQSATVRLSAIGQPSNVTAINVDTISIEGGPVVSVIKSASVASTTPGANLSYTLNAQNTGAAAAAPVPVIINGATLQQFLLRDAIPANTTYVSLNSSNSGARILYHRRGDAAGNYVDVAPDAAAVDAVGVGLPELSANTSVMATLGVAVHGNASGTLTNTAFADFSAAASDHTSNSNLVSVALPALAPTINFYTSDTYTTLAKQTSLGMPLYLQINASQCNTDPTLVVTHAVTLVSARSGDTETFAAVETAPNTGLFRVVPDVPTSNAALHAVAAGNAVLEVLPNDHVTATLSGCGPGTASATELIDPIGVVFDSKTNLPVAGATVSLIDVTGAGNGGRAGGPAKTFAADGTTSVPNTVTTDSGGSYSFALVPASTYRILVTPPNGYAFPSQLVPAQLPTGRNIDNTGSYGASFTISGAGAPVTIDVPLDAVGAGGLFLQKVASKSSAELGDFVDYSITLTNNSGLSFSALLLNDTLPAGFAYIKGSARLNNTKLTDPVGGAGPNLVFGVGTVSSGAPSILTYRVNIGPGAAGGDGVNTAQLVSGRTHSNKVTARVQIVGGVLSEKAFLFGKVYADCNADRIQNDGEPGIPGVRIFLDDGTYSVTDSAGKYSLYGLSPRTHVAKVDVTTLPKDTVLEVLEIRNAQDPGSQFADLHNGEMHKADFAITQCSPQLTAQIGARRKSLSDASTEITRTATEKIDLGATPTSDARTLPASGLIGINAFSNPATRAAPATTLPASGPSESVAPPAPAKTLEQLLRTITPQLGFIDLIDGQVLPIDQTRIRVKGPFDAQVRLDVNGRMLDLTQVGEHSRLESRGVSAWEYVGVNLKPGQNELTLSMVDGFGIARRESIRVIAPGSLAKIVVTVPAVASADTQKSIDIDVALLDAHGVAITARTPLTLEASLGEWQTPDLDPKQAGTQVFIDGGVGHFALLPPLNPGAAKLRVSSGTVQTTADITFEPNLRPLIAAGVVEGTFSAHGQNSNSLSSGQGTNAFERDIQAASRSFDAGKYTAAAATSMFLKGEIPGSSLLTFAYDSDKPADTTLLRDIQPDRFYPVYGDSSLKGFDAQSTGKLYARVDHGTSFALFGDYSSQDVNPARILTQYNRVLNGAKTHLEDGTFTVDAFLSDADSTQFIDEIPANGTSGPYRLSRLTTVVNSQRVEIITRDRNQPSIVLAEQTLEQFTDYAVEPEFGEILFKAPVPSLDANLNPIYIRVTYEVSNGGPSYWVGGVDVRDKLTATLTFGGIYVRDSNAANQQTLDGLNLLWQPNAATSIIGEWGQTQSDLEGNGAARRIEIKHSDPGLQVRVYAVQTDPTFNNPNSTYTAGASEYGAKVGYAIDSKDRIVIDALKSATATGASITPPSSIPLVGLPATIAGGAQRNGENIALERKLSNDIKLTAGLRHVDANAVPTQPLAIGAVPDEFTSARVRIDALVPELPKATAFVQYEDALDSSKRDATTVGGTYQLGPQSKLYATHETSDSLSGSYGLSGTQQNYSSVLGIDTSYMKDGQLFNEFRVGEGIDGRSDEAAIGLRNLWHLAPGLGLSTSVQQIRPISGVVTDNATALAAALQYTASPDWKGSTRLEWSQSSTAQTWLSSAAVAAKLDPDNTLLTRGIYNEQINTGASGGGIHLSEAQVGLAMRPVSSDVWNALALIEYKHSANSSLGAGFATNERALILSTHLNVQPTADWLVNARYGAKRASDLSGVIQTNGITQLLGARSIWDLNSRWDLGMQVFTEFQPNDLGGQQWAFGAEAGYLMIENVWMSVGYNLQGFRDPDLAGEEFTQRSFYVRLRFKFDENLFKPRNNGHALPAGAGLPP